MHFCKRARIFGRVTPPYRAASASGFTVRHRPTTLRLGGLERSSGGALAAVCYVADGLAIYEACVILATTLDVT